MQVRLQAQSPELPISVAITKDDIRMLGGWPIERRWYGIAIQRLQTAGAKRIFIDIAFPSADILHPESDDFFFQIVEQFPNMYLLSDEVQSDQARYTLLGTKYLGSDRFVSPFSA